MARSDSDGADSLDECRKLIFLRLTSSLSVVAVLVGAQERFGLGEERFKFRTIYVQPLFYRDDALDVGERGGHGIGALF